MLRLDRANIFEVGRSARWPDGARVSITLQLRLATRQTILLKGCRRAQID